MKQNDYEQTLTIWYILAKKQLTDSFLYQQF